MNAVSFESSSEAMSYFANKIITLSGKQRGILSQIMAIGEKCFKRLTSDSKLMGMTLREDANPFELQNLKNQLELLLIDMYEKGESTSSKPESSNYENQNAQISEALGFTTVHYFSKLFKSKLGVSPSEYAKSVYKK